MSNVNFKLSGILEDYVKPHDLREVINRWGKSICASADLVDQFNNHIDYCKQSFPTMSFMYESVRDDWEDFQADYKYRLEIEEKRRLAHEEMKKVILENRQKQKSAKTAKVELTEIFDPTLQDRLYWNGKKTKHKRIVIKEDWLSLEDLQNEYLLWVFYVTDKHVTSTADILGISVRTVRNVMRDVFKVTDYSQLRKPKFDFSRMQPQLYDTGLSTGLDPIGDSSTTWPTEVEADHIAGGSGHL